MDDQSLDLLITITGDSHPPDILPSSTFCLLSSILHTRIHTYIHTRIHHMIRSVFNSSRLPCVVLAARSARLASLPCYRSYSDDPSTPSPVNQFGSDNFGAQRTPNRPQIEPGRRFNTPSEYVVKRQDEVAHDFQAGKSLADIASSLR